MRSFNDYLKREERRSWLRDEQWRIERNRRRTREEQKMRKITLVTNSILLVLLLIAAIASCTTEATSQGVETGVELTAPAPSLKELELESIVAAADVNKPAEEPVTYEDWFRSEANRIDDCMLTRYCTELYEHICGTGDGLTATGVPVTAGWTCAVDKSVIPYGAEVMVDYGDRVEFYKAQDCGAWIKGNHIDLAVETHAEADDLGIKYATVYWLLPEEADTIE